MFCRQCRVRNEEGSRFCESCGTKLVVTRKRPTADSGLDREKKTSEHSPSPRRTRSVNENKRTKPNRNHDASHSSSRHTHSPNRHKGEANRKRNRKRNKKKLIVLGLGVLLLVAILLTGWIFMNVQNARAFNDAIGEGNRYLLEENLEQAKAHFLRAIEIRPREVEPYLALADIYMTWDEPEEAIAILEQGLEAVPERERPALEEALDEIHKILELESSTNEEVVDEPEVEDIPEEEYMYLTDTTWIVDVSTIDGGGTWEAGSVIGIRWTTEDQMQVLSIMGEWEDFETFHAYSYSADINMEQTGAREFVLTFTRNQTVWGVGGQPHMPLAVNLLGLGAGGPMPYLGDTQVRMTFTIDETGEFLTVKEEFRYQITEFHEFSLEELMTDNPDPNRLFVWSQWQEVDEELAIVNVFYLSENPPDEEDLSQEEQWEEAIPVEEVVGQDPICGSCGSYNLLWMMPAHSPSYPMECIDCGSTNIDFRGWDRWAQ